MVVLDQGSTAWSGTMLGLHEEFAVAGGAGALDLPAEALVVKPRTSMGLLDQLRRAAWTFGSVQVTLPRLHVSRSGP